MQFGLGEKETKIYLALIVNGRMKASDLSRRLRMHRLDVYNALKTLQVKEIVEGSLSKPMVFGASPLEIVVQVLRHKHEEEVRRDSEALMMLEDATEKVNQLLINRNLDEGEGSSRSERIQILSGRKVINEKWTKLLSSAENEILVVAMEKGAAQALLLNSIDIISEKMKKGVLVRIFTPITKSNAAEIRPIQKEVRHLVTSSSAGLCVVDDKHAMIVTETGDRNVVLDQKREETAIITDSKSIVDMFRTLFFVGWDTSPLFEETIEKMMTKL